MASWDSYIDTIIQGSGGQCEKACIIGKDGSRWTTDGHPKALKLTSEDVQKICSAIKGGAGDFMASGVRIDGIKYTFLRDNEGTYLFKQKDHGAITIQPSVNGIVVAKTGEGLQQGPTNCGVASIVDYLKSLNC